MNDEQKALQLQRQRLFKNLEKKFGNDENFRKVINDLAKS